MQACTHSTISTGRDFRETLRAGPYAWPGGYPLYFVTVDGDALSFATARENAREILWCIRSADNTGGWRVVGCQVNWEDSGLFCDHSGERIESAYAED